MCALLIPERVLSLQSTVHNYVDMNILFCGKTFKFLELNSF